MTFGEWVKQTRRQRSEKMTQEDLAKAIGVTKGYISQIENDNSPSTGLPPRVSDEHLRALATALGVEEQEIFTRATDVVPAGFRIVPREEHPSNCIAMLVREFLAAYPGGDEITLSEVTQISEELEDFAYVRIGRRVRRPQERQEPERKHLKKAAQLV